MANVRKFAPEGGEKRERGEGEREREAEKGSGGGGKRLSFSKDEALPSQYHRVYCVLANDVLLYFSLSRAFKFPMFFFYPFLSEACA